MVRVYKVLLEVLLFWNPVVWKSSYWTSVLLLIASIEAGHPCDTDAYWQAKKGSLLKNWSTRPTTVTSGRDDYFHTGCPYVRLSVRLSQNFKSDGWDCGLAEWIIDLSWKMFVVFQFFPMVGNLYDLSTYCYFLNCHWPTDLASRETRYVVIFPEKYILPSERICMYYWSTRPTTVLATIFTQSVRPKT